MDLIKKMKAGELQNGFSLSDTAMKEALYEITSMRQFARLYVGYFGAPVSYFPGLSTRVKLPPFCLTAENGSSI